MVAGPTGCSKWAWVLRLVDNVEEMIEPPPAIICYCYGQFQAIFSNYPQVAFHEGLRELEDEAFDGLQPTLMIVDDLMAETNQLVAKIFTKISHHRHINVLYLTQNVFDKNKHNRTTSLNARCLIVFKNVCDGTQFATLSRQMYQHWSRFAIEAHADAMCVRYGYLLVDLKPNQEARFRLRMNILPGEKQYVYVKNKGAANGEGTVKPLVK